MNVFFRELKARRKSLIIWTVGMVVFIVLSIVKYDSFSQMNAQAIQQLFDQFPQTVKAVFGMSELDPSTLPGYFAICYLLYAVMLAIYSGLLGTQLLTDEEQDRTTEFLFAKPISRLQILRRKITAGLVLVVYMWGIALIANYAAIESLSDMGSFQGDFFLLMAATGVIQLLFFALGLFASTISKSSTSPAKIITLAVLGSYLLFILAKLSDAFAWLHYVSVFGWFDAVDIIDTHSLKLHYLIASAIGFVLLLAIASITYRNRDFRT